MRSAKFLLLIALGLGGHGLMAEAADWPQFRGPGGLGIAPDKGLPTKWDADSNIAWKTALPGPGSSSPIVIGDKIFVTCHSGYGVEGQDGDMADLKRHLICLERDGGKIVWDRSVPAVLPETRHTNFHELHSFASSTPVSDGKHVWVFFGKSGVLAFDMKGKQLWKVSVGTGTHGWGSATSPVLHKNLLIVNASVESGSLVALNKLTGEEVWRAKGINQSWSTPVLVDVPKGNTELVVSGSKKVLGFDPDTGEELWHTKSFIWYVCPSVVAHDGIVFALQNSACVAIRAGGKGDVTKTHTLWAKNTGSVVSSAVYHQGHLFFATKSAFCLNAKDGTVVYNQRLKPTPEKEVYASPLLADGKIYYVSRTDGTYVLPAGPKFAIMAHNSLRPDTSVCNASPIAHNSQLLLRSNRFLYCIGKEK